ncbi:MAG: VWA domain-containing protein [Bryobacterales bacterium]|nr:VWA domain-containing protein [Bryobacterales bacterium]
MRRQTLALTVLCALLGLAANASTRLLVTVVDRDTMAPVTDLKAADLRITDGNRERSVETVEKVSGPMDVALLVDSSSIGEIVQPAAANIIEQLAQGDQMSIVAFDSAATVVQDFTSSKEALAQSLRNLKYGNNPHILDAVFAVIDGAFTDAGARPVVILITPGLEAGSRVSESRLYRLAQRNEVSIYPLFVGGYKGMFQDLAERTGGIALSLQDMARKTKLSPGEAVFGLIRNQYVVTISGDLPLGDKAKVEMQRSGKYRIGFREGN